MFNINKSLSILVVGFCLLISTVFLSPVFADENNGNVPSDANTMMEMSESQSMSLPFDPNNYRFLTYNPGGNQPSIEDAMELLGIHTYTRRGYVNGVMVEVTPNDLATHDILIVGWNDYGSTSGLHSDDLAAGITGRVILTGHDLDYHTATKPNPYAQTMLIQAINYVLAGGGTGMITLGCTATPSAFPYLPKEWGVNANALPSSGGEDVNEFTTEGLASGVYDGLTPVKMSNWGTSYHDVFTIEPGSDFVRFELGGGGGNDIITIARLWSGCGVKLTKTDDVNDGNCVGPGREITYTIDYNYPAGPNLPEINDVNIVDYLPDDVRFVSADSNGTYKPTSHTVTWNIGTLEPNQSGLVMLTVKVNKCISACGEIINYCEAKTGCLFLGSGFERTPVCIAGGPRPAAGEPFALDVNKPPDINLVWCRGRFAADVNGHDVYFGTDLSNVIDANGFWPIATGPNDPNVHKGRQTSNTYKARGLAPYTTYFWRIDEVNGLNTWPGPVWAFTTGLFIDNFDTDIAGRWKVIKAGNALSQCRADASGYNGATLPLVTTPGLSWDSGAKTMVYDFNNDYVATGHDGFAEARLDYGTAGCDWTIGDSKILSISYLGRADNDANEPYDTMYVMLEDANGHQGKIVQNDANAQQRTTWEEWQIKLSDLNSPNDTFPQLPPVNLTKIRYLRLGFGDRCNMATLEGPRGGAGRVIFDNIRLKRCGLTADLNNDCVMDINDLDVLSEQWLICGICYAKADIYPPDKPDSIVNFEDFAVFAAEWLIEGGTGMSAEGAASSTAPETGESPALVDETSVATATVEEPAASEEATEPASTLAGEGETAGIWLVYDGNMTPNSGDEITVYIHSDPMLLCMGIAIDVAGDANITTAMSEADCNNYGWDNGWDSDPYIDPSGWLSISGVSWERVVNGTVGYFKFRYNSGEVTVSINDEDICAYDADCQPVLSSGEPLIFGRDPNEQ